jgi:uncharacterized protein (DUF1697 family)
MPVCISFLRGVNMAGHNLIKMTDLSLLFKDIGLTGRTFIQSGNVIFSLKSDKDIEGTGSVIEAAIRKKYGYDIPVMIRTANDLEEIISNNPFHDEKNFDPAKMAVIFLHEKPSEDQLLKVADVDYPPDKFKIIDREIFIYCPDGFGKTKLYTNFFEKKMGVTGTARNLKTIKTLHNMALEK